MGDYGSLVLLRRSEARYGSIVGSIHSFVTVVLQ
jgi:hypothetical protein